MAEALQLCCCSRNAINGSLESLLWVKTRDYRSAPLSAASPLEAAITRTRRHAYSITSSAVARSEGEIDSHLVSEKGGVIQCPRDGWWVSDVWGALDGHIPPVYSQYQPRIPWVKAATLSAFCSIAV
jgi:hypothetical protein